MKKVPISLTLVSAVALFTLQAKADVIDWSNAAGGEFSEGGNWVGGVAPGGANTARFNIDEVYQVMFFGDVTNTALRVGDGQVSFDLFSTFTYTLSESAIIASSGSGQLGLAVTGGTLSIGTQLEIGNIAGRDASLSLSGSGTSLTAGTRLLMGAANTTSELNISGGATATINGTSSANLGGGSGGVANITVDGSGSSLTINTTVNFGNSSGSVSNTIVSDGGFLRVGGGNVSAGAVSGSESLIVVTGAGSELEFYENFFLGGTTDSGGGIATLIVADGGKVVRDDKALIVTDTGIIRGNGTLDLGSSNLTMRGGIVSPGLPGDPSVSIDPSTGTLTLTGNYLHQRNGGGILRFHIEDAGSYDRLVVSGNMDIQGMGGLEILELGTTSLAAGQSFNIIDYGGSFLGEFDWIHAFDPGAGLSWDFSELYSDGIISVIPEPSTIALLFAAVALLGTIAIRRR